ncbi:TPA: hypothetical protein DCQ22_04165 [Candidatus Nomurabacteria bacterium]|nr:hypothetical protein [Candidatus Nomurabacteria bacterium]
MSRDVPFDPEAVCDGCGRRGSFDFMGDFFCQDCISADAIDECICESLDIPEGFIEPNPNCPIHGKEKECQKL